MGVKAGRAGRPRKRGGGFGSRADLTFGELPFANPHSERGKTMRKKFEAAKRAKQKSVSIRELKNRLRKKREKK